MATAYRVLFSVERVGHRFVDFDATALPQAGVAGRRWKNTDLNATANTEQHVDSKEAFKMQCGEWLKEARKQEKESKKVQKRVQQLQSAVAAQPKRKRRKRRGRLPAVATHCPAAATVMARGTVG